MDKDLDYKGPRLGFPAAFPNVMKYAAIRLVLAHSSQATQLSQRTGGKVSSGESTSKGPEMGMSLAHLRNNVAGCGEKEKNGI